jgi:hypothetical protein
VGKNSAWEEWRVGSCRAGSLAGLEVWGGGALAGGLECEGMV